MPHSRSSTASARSRIPATWINGFSRGMFTDCSSATRFPAGETGRGITASSRPDFGTRRQEGSAVLLEPGDGKLSDRPGGSCPVGILDERALVTAQKYEHGVLGNRQNHL